LELAMKSLMTMHGAFGSLALTALALSGTSAAAQQVPFFIVVNPDNPVEMLSREFISAIYLKTSTNWKDGTPIEPIDLTPESRIREAFSREVHDRGTADVQKYWQEKAAEGGETAPPEAASEADAVEFVRQHRGGIAYVSTSAPLDGVLLVAVVRPPVAVDVVPPEYTERAARMGIEGSVVLRVQVSERGEPEDITVIKGLPAGLTAAAVRAVKQWHFDPATAGGVPVSADMEVTVKFSL